MNGAGAKNADLTSGTVLTGTLEQQMFFMPQLVKYKLWVCLVCSLR